MRLIYHGTMLMVTTVYMDVTASGGFVMITKVFTNKFLTMTQA
jgi:hypothetical protein